MTDPVRTFLEQQGFLVLDGGLATELESSGCDLSDELWSAQALLDAPDAVRTAHRRYLEAGADCIATATYQATFEGFRARGLEEADTTRLLEHAVEIAVSARDDFMSDLSISAGRLRPLVAASIGPYGAFLADGSEYRGDYGLSAADLYDFHAPRWQVLAETAADLLACETTPSVEEARAYCRLAAVSHRPTWISFQCRDRAHLADGTPLETAVALCDAEPHVVAVGVNCTDPGLTVSLIGAARRATGKPILVYPNSGEVWDAEAKRWTGAANPVDWARSAAEWLAAGADGIGGCCRVGPSAIAAIRARTASSRRTVTSEG
ncbi:homocysteine S-methyltransferase [Candidatus Palauibacter sp.]|uniref:homocysteine S-methyltransferase n=1 Tax=Candidatus Palauibacter sp. TaxID=3101350 RepID=UPI003B52EB7E